jgi:thiol:disulfide interchange protein DsbC
VTRSRLLGLAVAMVVTGASTYTAAAEPPPAAPPTLDAAAVQRAVPGVQVKSIRQVPIRGGLYEVIDDKGNAFYLDGAGGIGFQCDLFDVANRKNLTQESLARFKAVDFSQLPLDLAITRVKGDGRRKIAVFADPDCPFCVKLEQELEAVDNVTVHTFLYPIATLHPQAVERSRRIWCSADRDAAWRGWLLNQRDAAPAAEGCTSPVEEIAKVAQKFGLSGTPSLVFPSGRVVGGFVPRAVIEEYFGEPSLLPAAGAVSSASP